MPADRDVLSDLLSLSMQLNRQAFARPPVEGWLNSFLAVLYERFSNQNVQRVQVLHAIGTVAVEIGSAGSKQGGTSEQQYTLEESSPIAQAIHSRQMVTAPDMHVYPILVGEDPIGALIAYSDAPGPDIDPTFGLFASQLGPAIMQQVKVPGAQTGRLMRQIDLMRSMSEATQSAGVALDQSEILTRAAQSLVDSFKIDHASIILFDFNQGIGTVVGEYPDHGFVGVNVELHGIEVNERLLHDRKPVIVSNVPEATGLGANLPILSKLGLKSVGFVPLVVGQEVIGYIGLDSYYEDRPFKPEDLDAAMTLAGQLAVNIRNAKLYDEMKRRANQLERIGYLSRRVTSTLDRLEIFQIVKEETSSLLEAEQISVSLREADSKLLKLFVLEDVRPKEIDFDLDESALRFSMIGSEALVLDDISGSQYPDYKFMAQSGMRAALIVPLVIGGR
ncbi:MAG TPA: GAF domain-containing protein, partial [Aggregatilineales bacterium]|nr:GAF domain-containing protein [Aggregatilineales bacterium]